MAMKSINPATGEVIREFIELTENEIDQKINQAFLVQKEWKQTSFDDRKSLVLKLAKYLRDHKDEFVKMKSLEIGKTISTGPLVVEKCATLCEYYAENAEKILFKSNSIS